MLSENAIDKLIMKVINSQRDINLYILAILLACIDDIKHGKKITPEKQSQDLKIIDDYIAGSAIIQIALISNLYNIIAEDIYSYSKSLYELKNVKYKKFKANKAISKIPKQYLKDTVKIIDKFIKSPKFIIDDKPLSFAETYNYILNKSYEAYNTPLDFDTVVQPTINNLVNSGINIVTNKTIQKVDNVLQNDITESIKNISQDIQSEAGKQFGADGVEITVHACPAPDHAPVQGHQFTNKEFNKLQNGQDFEDVNGIKFKGFERAIGTWNCRHFTFSIVVGSTPPTLTDKQLQDILDDNEKGYTLPNGKHLTMYECTQMQRYYERQIRKNKIGQVSARKADNKPLAQKYQAKVNHYTDEYISFSNACGLNLMKHRTAISSYRKIKVDI